jgi:uncharacterized protein (DUF486 family)
MGWVRSNGLALFFGALFLATLVAQAFTGQDEFNHAQIAHMEDPVSVAQYVTSSAYWVDVLENWQSEYLQFTLFIFVTVWLLQRGSPESKPPDKVGTESDEDQRVGQYATEKSPKWAHARGLRLWLYSNSLVLVMGTIWVASWLGQSVTGRVVYNAEQLDHHEAAVSWARYVTTSDFWNRTLQNWQSEFLAVGSMAVLAIYLRQRGSPESKPVGAPHESTGVEG